MPNAVAVWTGLEELRDDLQQYLAFRCGDTAEIDDVIQETFLRAARYRVKLVEPERLRAWTLRIASNVLTDRARRERRLRRVGSGDALLAAQASPDSAGGEEGREVECGGWVMDWEVALELVAGELRRMRSDDREILTSYYGGEASCREVARTVDLAPDVVKVRLFRARRRLLRALRRRLAACDGLARRPA
jgi:RNA polymerase sigma-70 factor (ECF subfamily)